MNALQRMVASALFAAGFSNVSVYASAQDWAPSKPGRIVVPVVGSIKDVLAGLVAEKLRPSLGQAAIVENKHGASGNAGTDMDATSPLHGHTLLVGYNGPLALDPTLFDNMPFDPLKDLAPALEQGHQRQRHQSKLRIAKSWQDLLTGPR